MSRDNYNKLSNDELDFVDDKTAALLLNTPNSARLMLWVMVLFFVAAIGWASWAQIDQVTVGQGKVIPSSQIQVVQNLEGGLVKEILVKEGQLVKKGQQLLLIDDTRFRSDYREREQQVANLTASVLQLSASINSVAVNRDFNIQDWEKKRCSRLRQTDFPTGIGRDAATINSASKSRIPRRFG